MIDENKLIESIKDVEVAWYIDGNYTTYDSTTIMDIIEEQPKVGEWIPVSERLPEEGVPVLICIVDEGSEEMVVTARADYNYWSGLGRDIKGVCAWMPLPEPYKEEVTE